MISLVIFGNFDVKTGVEENASVFFHEKLRKCSRPVHYTLFLLSKKIEIISNRINIQMAYNYFVQFSYTIRF